MGTGGKIAIGCGIAALIAVVAAAGQAYDQMAERLRKAAEAAGGKDEASRKALEKSLKDMDEQADDVREAARSMDVPQANVELFRKHEAEIKKYAMNGLEWLGI